MYPGVRMGLLTIAAVVLFVSATEVAGVVSEDAATAHGGKRGDPAAGRVRLVRNARPDFDHFIKDSTAAERAFIRDHYWRLRGYPPASDTALLWGPPVQFYADLYALYPSDPQDASLIAAHPDWILRDAGGNPLYIPYACSAGTCPAYAADLGNPAWRHQWTAEARSELQKGYSGVFIDNVNMTMSVGDGSGNAVAPIDPRTGQL